MLKSLTLLIFLLFSYSSFSSELGRECASWNPYSRAEIVEVFNTVYTDALNATEKDQRTISYIQSRYADFFARDYRCIKKYDLAPAISEVVATQSYTRLARVITDAMLAGYPELKWEEVPFMCKAFGEILSHPTVNMDYVCRGKFINKFGRNYPAKKFYYLLTGKEKTFKYIYYYTQIFKARLNELSYNDVRDLCSRAYDETRRYFSYSTNDLCTKEYFRLMRDHNRKVDVYNAAANICYSHEAFGVHSELKQIRFNRCMEEYATYFMKDLDLNEFIARARLRSIPNDQLQKYQALGRSDVDYSPAAVIERVEAAKAAYDARFN